MGEDVRQIVGGVLLRVAYDGTKFHGWAVQNDVRTVAGELNAAIRKVDDQASITRGASRTDTGVHALGQLAAFSATRTIHARGWAMGINSFLPSDVSVQHACFVEKEFNPRFANDGKRYIYRILRAPLRHPIAERFAWRPAFEFDTALMQKEAEFFAGTHDFRAFSSKSPGHEKENTVRRLRSVVVEELERGLISVTVHGDAFLYNMVRIMVGTLVEVGAGRRLPGSVQTALVSKKRRDAGTTAPAHGLTLDEIFLRDHVICTDPWP